jgi:hypothetical protein
MSRASNNLAHSLVPLDLAADLIRVRVYGEKALRSSGREQLLNSIATTIAVVAGIYEYTPEQPARVQRLSRSELEAGVFKGGAKELRFLDGRAPRGPLAVTPNDIEVTVEALQRAAR